MAQQGNQLDREKLCCSVCLDLLKDPVTPSCGHSYCRSCIEDHWDSEEVRGIYSCPQCREAFTPRPELKRNIVLADLVEELKKTGLQAAPTDYCAAPADHCAAGPEDVACDACIGRKVKALKSCLVCLASYCENHLQPHFDVAPLKKHKLVEPCEKLQENICPRHDEVMKMFCRTDQQCICYLCSVDEHKGHDIVSAAAERTERQEELEETRVKIQQRVQDTEGDVKLLQQQAVAIKASADGAVDHNDKIFTELISDLQRSSSEVTQQIRSQQEIEERRVKELQEKLEQEITELKRRDADLKQLAHTQDHKRFLQDYTSLPTLAPSTHSSSSRTRPLRLFEDLTAAVSQVRGQILDVLTEARTNISQAVAPVDVLLKQPEPEPEARTDISQAVAPVDVLLKQPEPEPEASTNISQAVAPVDVLPQQSKPEPKREASKKKSQAVAPVYYPWMLLDIEPENRAEFLKYAIEITLDPNTMNDNMLSDGNGKVTRENEKQSYSKHSGRFSYWCQVLSRESLTGRCYWEVKWREGVNIAVSYKSIKRAGRCNTCRFGNNDKSWSLDCNKNSSTFFHNNIRTPLSGPVSSRVGVYLDHTAGVLAFYNISRPMTLILRVQTIFTKPLRAGLFLYPDSNAKVCKLK